MAISNGVAVGVGVGVGVGLTGVEVLVDDGSGVSVAVAESGVGVIMTMRAVGVGGGVGVLTFCAICVAAIAVWVAFTASSFNSTWVKSRVPMMASATRQIIRITPAPIAIGKTGSLVDGLSMVVGAAEGVG